MPFSIHVKLKMAYRSMSARLKDSNKRSQPNQVERLPFPTDATEVDLSPEVYALQRRVREEMRKTHRTEKTRKCDIEKTAPKSRAKGLPDVLLRDKTMVGTLALEYALGVVHGVFDFERRPYTDLQLHERESTDTRNRPVVEEDWELVNLSDVQPTHLEKMDLTDLAPSLLDHAERSSLDYTADERKTVQRLLQRDSR